MAIGTFVPESVQPDMELKLWEFLPISVMQVAMSLRDADWRFYVVNQSRGRCYFRPRVITIPVFARQKTVEYKTWYVCHEMAHAIAGPKARHGEDFMVELKRICPPAAIYHELGYMPRAASKMGIKKPFAVAKANIQGAL